MRLPRIKELYNPIMYLVGFLGKADLGTIRNRMQDYFFFGEDLDDDMQTAFEGRVNNACTNLFKAEQVDRESRGVYKLSSLGKKVLEDGKYICNIDVKAEDVSASISQVVSIESVQKISIKSVIEMCKFDTRIYNAIEFGKIFFDGGDIRYSEKDEAQIEKLTDELGHLTFAITKEGYHHYGSRIQKIWENTMPWANESGGIDKYRKTKELLERVREKKTFSESFTELMSAYEIKETELAKRTGVNVKKLQRMRTNDNANIEIRELAAIFIVLKVPPQIVSFMVQRGGLSLEGPMNEKYITIIHMASGSSFAEINEYCREAEVQEIFSADLENNIA